MRLAFLTVLLAGCDLVATFDDINVEDGPLVGEDDNNNTEDTDGADIDVTDTDVNVDTDVVIDTGDTELPEGNAPVVTDAAAQLYYSEADGAYAWVFEALADDVDGDLVAVDAYVWDLDLGDYAASFSLVADEDPTYFWTYAWEDETELSLDGAYEVDFLATDATGLQGYLTVEMMGQ